MKPGEYIGDRDKRLYIWIMRDIRDCTGAVTSLLRKGLPDESDRIMPGVPISDLRAAAAALVALADERETEYVELNDFTRLAVRGDDIVMEARLGTGLKWGPVLHPNALIIAAFRSGQERGKA